MGVANGMTHASLLHSKVVRICVLLATCGLLYALHAQWSSSLPHMDTPVTAPLSTEESQLPPEVDLPHTCKLNRTQLARFKLSPKIQYARRFVRYRQRVEHEHHSYIDVNEPLVGSTQEVNMEADYSASDEILTLPECTRTPISLPGPPIDTRSYGSDIVFGMSTKVPRVRDAMPEMLHWLARSKASVVAVTPRHDLKGTTQQRLRNAGLDITIESTHVGYLKAYFALIKYLHKAMQDRPHAKWAAFIDDDTFFPSMKRLAETLGKYDPSKPQYVGALSEDFHQVRKHGYYAFGGAGIFVSRPLLDQLAASFDQCEKQMLSEWGGDYRIYACISNFTNAELSYERGLHQMDWKGNLRGFYESGRDILSLHHYKSWHHFDVPRAAAVSEICGDECILKRWRFPGDQKTHPSVLTNGYSIVQFPAQVPDLDRMEHTWGLSGEELGKGRSAQEVLMDFSHSVAPLRRKLEERKDRRTFDLINVVHGTGGELKQTYVNKNGDHGQDQVIELIWLRS